MTPTEIKNELRAVSINATEEEILDRLTAAGFSKEDIPAIVPSDMDEIIKIFSTGSSKLAPAPTPIAPKKRGGSMTRSQRKQLEKLAEPAQEIPIDVEPIGVDRQVVEIEQQVVGTVAMAQKLGAALGYVRSNFGSMVLEEASNIAAQNGQTTIDFRRWADDLTAANSRLDAMLDRYGIEFGGEGNDASAA